MNFEDELFVKLYTRDTVTWKMLEWQGRTVLMHLLRKVDRAGCLDLSECGIDGICAVIEVPEEVTNPGLDKCMKRGSVVIEGNQLRIPRFIAGQAARQSDRARARASRQRRAVGLSRGDTPSSRNETASSQNVTDPSREVTERHAESPIRREEKRRDQNRKEDPPVVPAAALGPAALPVAGPKKTESPKAAASPDGEPAKLEDAWKALTALCPKLRPAKDWASSTGLNPSEEGALGRQWVDAQQAGYTLADIVGLADWIKGSGALAMRASPREYLCRNLSTALDDAAKWRADGQPERGASSSGVNPRRVGTTSTTREVKTWDEAALRAAADRKRTS